MKTAYDQLRVCVMASPTGKEQEAFGRMYTNMQVDGLSDEEMTMHLAMALVDGLKHGNWPTTPEVKKS
jgi:hypothetical protein